MTDDNKPKPYMDLASLIMDGFGDATQEGLAAMVKTGYFGYFWGDDILVSKIVPPGTVYCECQPRYENNGVLTDMRDPNSKRVDVRCAACQEWTKKEVSDD